MREFLTHVLTKCQQRWRNGGQIWQNIHYPLLKTRFKSYKTVILLAFKYIEPKNCVCVPRKRTCHRIAHFTNVSLVIWPLSGSEAGVDLVLIKTLLLFTCKSCCSHAN